MHGLNHSVIMGKCPSCLIYEERVARLEDEKAALAAALREALEYLETMGLSLKIQDSIRAALSDTQTGTAGEGWPEVREQAWEVLAKLEWSGVVVKPFGRTCPVCRIGRQARGGEHTRRCKLAAALDALEVT